MKTKNYALMALSNGQLKQGIYIIDGCKVIVK